MRVLTLAVFATCAVMLGCGGGSDGGTEPIQEEDLPALDQSFGDAITPYIEDSAEMVGELIAPTQGAPTSVEGFTPACQLESDEGPAQCLVRVGIVNAINGPSSLFLDYDLTLEDDEKCWTAELSEIFDEEMNDFPVDEGDTGPGMQLSGCL